MYIYNIHIYIYICIYIYTHRENPIYTGFFPLGGMGGESPTPA